MLEMCKLKSSTSKLQKGGGGLLSLRQEVIGLNPKKLIDFVRGQCLHRYIYIYRRKRFVLISLGVDFIYLVMKKYLNPASGFQSLQVQYIQWA